MGEVIRLVGSSEELGGWNPDAGVVLTTSPNLYPQWTGNVYFKAVPEQSAIEIEYKYVRDRTSMSDGLVWESLREKKPSKNRQLCLQIGDAKSSAQGTWFVCDPSPGLQRASEVIFIPACKFARDGAFESSYQLIGEDLGFGSYGTVRRCWQLQSEAKDCHSFAAKQIVKAKLKQTEVHKLMGSETTEGEIALHMAQSHPHIVELFEVFDEPGQMVLVMEACDGGDLLDYVQHHAMKFGFGVSEEASTTVMGQLLSALDYLHQQRIVHRDVKCENVLLRHRCTALENNVCKLCDLGFAARLPEDGFLKDPVGSLDYASPEVLTTPTSYGTSSDLWAAGVVFYILLSSQQPFFADTDREVVQKIRGCMYSMEGDMWDTVSETSKTFIRGLISLYPGRRHTAAAALLKRFTALFDGPSIPVTFQVKAETRMGETLRVVGNSAELGDWDPASGLALTTNPEMYPEWRATVYLRAPFSRKGLMDVEYKYVRDRRCVDGVCSWEEMPWNRRFKLMVDYDWPGERSKSGISQSGSGVHQAASPQSSDGDMAVSQQSGAMCLPHFEVGVCKFDHFNGH